MLNINIDGNLSPESQEELVAFIAQTVTEQVAAAVAKLEPAPAEPGTPVEPTEPLEPAPIQVWPAPVYLGDLIKVVDMDLKAPHHLNTDRYPDFEVVFVSASESTKAFPEATVKVQGTKAFTAPQITEWVNGKPAVLQGPGYLYVQRTRHGGKDVWSGAWASVVNA